jgi:diguanylate cyclase (GGDEF)-like protein/PAS domain S-box-containing protein
VTFRRHAWIVYLAVAAALTAAYVAAPPLRGSGPLINLLGLSSAAAIAIGIFVHRPRAWVAWALFVVGQFLFFAGDLYTYSYPKLFGAEVEFPSLGDGIYLTVYPALVAGLLVLVRRRNPEGDGAGDIDSLILTVGVALLSWVFLVAPNVHLPGLTALEKAVSSAYPLGDILLLAAAIRLAVDRGRRAPSFFLLVGSIVALLATDSAYTYALLTEAYHHELIYDVGWIAYYVLWGAAALHPSMRSLEEPAVDSRTRLTRMRLVLLAGACLISPSIRFVQAVHDPDVLVLIVASAVLFLLVVSRMAGLVRQEEGVVARERALRAAGAELVAAASPAQVHDAAIAAVRALVGPTAHVRLVMLDEDRARVAASSTGESAWALSDETTGWVASTADATVRFGLRRIPETVRGELRLLDGQDVLLLPLSFRGDSRGVLVVCAVTVVPRQLVHSLEALASQTSLALEGVSLAEDLHRRQSETRFRSLVAHSSDLITVLDADGVVTYQSPAVERVLGYRVDEIEGTSFAQLVSAPDRARFAQVVSDVRDGSGENEHALECSLRHNDGTWLKFEIRHTNLLHDEHVRGIVLNARDVSERKAFEDQLAHQAFHDPVTGLANRALFVDRVQHALTRSTRAASPVGVLFIDLDDFKMVNDSLGHAAGDTVLHEVAVRLEEAVRAADTVARFGGDEFAVLLDGVHDSQDAADVAAKILRALEGQLMVDGTRVYCRASIGICLASRDADGHDAEALLRNADVAMYMAKRDSKGGYRIFEPEMHERVVERLELRAELQRALELEELEVHYQPVMRHDDRTVYGAEALLRWNHPTRGQISPAQFIPLAEETGLIVPIGRWVLNQACRQIAELHRSNPSSKALTISVNLSAKQLQSETVVADVREALETTGLPPETLVLEITETVMMDDADLAVARLAELRELGVRLAMDDFGTGYSSLSYLSRFPIDILKMDRSFLASGQADSNLAPAIIALGSSLDLEVVAEGIERSDQLATLQLLGCGLGQGFIFARPMPYDALLGFLAEDGGPAVDDAPQADAA